MQLESPGKDCPCDKRFCLLRVCSYSCKRDAPGAGSGSVWQRGGCATPLKPLAGFVAGIAMLCARSR